MRALAMSANLAVWSASESERLWFCGAGERSSSEAWPERVSRARLVQRNRGDTLDAGRPALIGCEGSDCEIVTSG